VESSFEIFDHTADAGIRVWAATLPELIEPALRGLYAVIGELAASGPEVKERFSREGREAAELLRDFLAEVLLLFERRHRMISSIKVAAFEETRLAGSYSTRGVDMDASVFYREVKAVTYHELDIRRTPDGFEATIIVDI
jgi:SHS2 domain-containing protein